MPCLSESKRSTFKWVGLNFVGTLGQWASPSPIERLKDPEALGTWLREAGLLAPAQTSEADLALARRLREAIHQLGVQRLETKALGGRNLARLNRAARWAALGALHLNSTRKKRYVTRSPLRFSLGRIAEDAIERFSSPSERLTRCELPGCGALLLSRSRSDRRRWCSMELCGNRAKVAAFRERQRARTKAKQRRLGEQSSRTDT